MSRKISFKREYSQSVRKRLPPLWDEERGKPGKRTENGEKKLGERSPHPMRRNGLRADTLRIYGQADTFGGG